VHLPFPRQQVHKIVASARNNLNDEIITKQPPNLPRLLTVSFAIVVTFKNIRHEGKFHTHPLDGAQIPTVWWLVPPFHARSRDGEHMNKKLSHMDSGKHLSCCRCIAPAWVRIHVKRIFIDIELSLSNPCLPLLHLLKVCKKQELGKVRKSKSYSPSVIIVND